MQSLPGRWIWRCQICREGPLGHFRVSHSTSRIDFHGPIWLITSVFEHADDAFGQCSVIGIANGSDREIDLGLSQALGILDGQVLRSAIRMVNQILVIRRFSLPDGLVQCVENELGLRECRAAPAVTRKGFACKSRRATIHRAKTSLIEPLERHWSEGRRRRCPTIWAHK